MADLLETLLEIERGFWEGGADFHEAHMTQNALLVFPEPVGVMTAERSLQATANSARWTRVTHKDPRLLRMTDTSVMVIYKAVAYEQAPPLRIRRWQPAPTCERGTAGGWPSTSRPCHSLSASDPGIGVR